MFKTIINESIKSRHFLHRNPELTWQEHGTTAFIRDRLSALDIAWESCTDTGTLARLNATAEGRHIALRGDIDALPIEEKSGVEYCSQNPACMHACGHDGHTATLLATAHWLKLNESALSGPVTLIYQPAEEGGHGAREMIAAGALRGVDEIYGWHNWPAIAYEQAVCPEGAVMSANSILRIEVIGRGGHASQPEACVDPVLAASAIVMAIQQIVARRLPPQVAAVVSITSFDAPSANNVIRANAILGGGIRASDTALRDDIAALVHAIAVDTARAYGCEVLFDNRNCYGATVNHPAAAAKFRAALADEFGERWQNGAIAVPIMASEDFSYYLEQVPGAFALIGADDGAHHAHPCHSPRYDFNDRLIERVVRLYARLVGAPLP